MLKFAVCLKTYAMTVASLGSDNKKIIKPEVDLDLGLRSDADLKFQNTDLPAVNISLDDRKIMARSFESITWAFDE